MRIAIYFFLLLLLLGTTACDKAKNPNVQTTFSEITADGVRMRASVGNDKDVRTSGFCFSKTSDPVLDTYNSFPTNISSKVMEKVLPFIFFESFTGYYIRPYVQTSEGVFYGDEVYYADVQSPPVTSACTPNNNFVSAGGGLPVETFNFFDVPEENTSFNDLRAHSNSYLFKFDFSSRIRTGIYTSTYGSDEDDEVHVSFLTGGISGSVTPGTPVYVNEVSKGKYEITLCNAPWELGNSTFYMTAKVVTP